MTITNYTFTKDFRKIYHNKKKNFHWNMFIGENPLTKKNVYKIRGKTKYSKEELISIIKSPTKKKDLNTSLLYNKKLKEFSNNSWIEESEYKFHYDTYESIIKSKEMINIVDDNIFSYSIYSSGDVDKYNIRNNLTIITIQEKLLFTEIEIFFDIVYDEDYVSQRLLPLFFYNFYVNIM